MCTGIRGCFAPLCSGAVLVATVLASQTAAGQTQVNQVFQSQGPGPSQGPLATVQSGEIIPNGTVTGAVGPIVSDPANNTIYLGTPNGGVFVSHNAGTSWSPLTDNQASLSISSLSLDPTDPTHQTLWNGDRPRLPRVA